VKHTITTTMKRRLRRKVEIDGPLVQTSTYATITDLPDELIEKIVEDLDDNGSICRLSLTCKRLHFLVLPMFFSRNKLGNLQNGFFHCYYPVPELLEAIRTALFVRNLSRFTFYFTSSFNQVISDISSLRGLLARIPPVGKILLGLPVHIQSTYGPPGVRSTVERWGREFLKLLETIAESGCKDLTLLDPVGYFSNNVLLNNLYVEIPPPVEPIGSKSRGAKNLGGFRAKPHLTGMSTIQLLSPRLFQPFFIGWIIDVLEVNRESLVSIHLNVASITPVLLSRISKSMNLPALKEVKISSHFSLIWEGLYRFLNRHPSINSLHLDGILPVKDPQIPDPLIVLPCLTQLTAMSPMVTLLLQHRNMVPLLSTVHVLLYLNAQSELDPLPAIATHTHISSLQLSNGVEGDICSILKRHISEDKSTRIITSLGHIRSVNLDQPINSNSSSLLTIKRWLYLFPHLEHVSLSSRLLDARLESSDEERHGVVTEFATQLAADRPMMKTLSVGFSLPVNLDDLRKMPGFKV